MNFVLYISSNNKINILFCYAISLSKGVICKLWYAYYQWYEKAFKVLRE